MARLMKLCCQHYILTHGNRMYNIKLWFWLPFLHNNSTSQDRNWYHILVELTTVSCFCYFDLCRLYVDTLHDVPEKHKYKCIKKIKFYPQLLYLHFWWILSRNLIFCTLQNLWVALHLSIKSGYSASGYSFWIFSLQHGSLLSPFNDWQEKHSSESSNVLAVTLPFLSLTSARNVQKTWNNVAFLISTNSL